MRKKDCVRQFYVPRVNFAIGGLTDTNGIIYKRMKKF